MIYYRTIYPERMAGAMLDEGLAHGWYRITQSFITTDLISYEDKLAPVFWLRIDLRRYKPSRSARRIVAKNSGYAVAIKPFAITTEIENLYQIYRQSIDFPISESVAEYLLDGGPANAFDSHLIEVRVAGRLVAVGYFDVGERTATGILHFYDPALNRASPGKYLFLIEIAYSLERNFDYYYMGYLSVGNAKFDYKLFADPQSTEVYLRPGNKWLPYEPNAPKILRWGKKISDTANRLYKLDLAPDESQS